ncbi:MAG: alpha/beta hydrolase fold domain-containing protein, partial [Verrucomicrobiota bacterium]
MTPSPLSPVPLFAIAALAACTLLAEESPEKDANITPDSDPAPEITRKWLAQMDKNSDRKLAEAETSGLMKRFFGRNDTNKDGYLDVTELKTLAGSLSNRTQRDRQRSRPGMNTQQLLNGAPADVKIIPDIVYREGESKAWRLDLVMPAAESEDPRPGIIFVHGGGWRGGDKRAGTFLNGAIEYAQKGYVCITVNYRLVGEAPLPACIEDVKCAVRWLRAHAGKYKVNPEKIGAFGNSAGAHLVCMLALTDKDNKLEGDGPYQEHSSAVQAVCAAATPTNFDLFASVRQQSGPGSLFGDAVGEARE